MVALSATEARAALPELLTRVEGGEEIVITRHGRPVAVLLRPDSLRHRRTDASFAIAAQIHELLASAEAAAAPPGKPLTTQRAEELIREIRAGRDER